MILAVLHAGCRSSPGLYTMPRAEQPYMGGVAQPAMTHVVPLWVYIQRYQRQALAEVRREMVRQILYGDIDMTAMTTINGFDTTDG